ncbi:MAG: hypothetical protein ABH862_02175 [Candidatus Omnitrophota bacterium]
MQYGIIGRAARLILTGELILIKKILIILIIAGVYFYFKTPSTDSIVRNMSIDETKGTIECKGTVYDAGWAYAKVYKGDIRYVGRAYHKDAPYITYDAIVTTGDFSDPSLVRVTPIRNGNMSWSASKKPDGTLIVLHFIPANKTVNDDLKRLKTGDKVELAGREESDSKITASDGNFVGLGHDNHKFFLLKSVRRI